LNKLQTCELVQYSLFCLMIRVHVFEGCVYTANFLSMAKLQPKTIVHDVRVYFLCTRTFRCIQHHVTPTSTFTLQSES